jgi:hypothetical protein
MRHDCSSALLANNYQNAAYRIHANALKISVTSAIYADNLVTGPTDPALRFTEPLSAIIAHFRKPLSTVNIRTTTFQP